MGTLSSGNPFRAYNAAPAALEVTALQAPLTGGLLTFFRTELCNYCAKHSFPSVLIYPLA